MELRIPEDGIPTHRQAVEEDRRGLGDAGICLGFLLAATQAPLSRLLGRLPQPSVDSSLSSHFLHPPPLPAQKRPGAGRDSRQTAEQTAPLSGRPCWGLPGKNVDRGPPTPPGLPHQPRSLTQSQTECLFSKESSSKQPARQARLIGLERAAA